MNGFINELIAFTSRLKKDSLPAEALKRVTDAIADTFGCIVLGHRQELAQKLFKILFPINANNKIENWLDHNCLVNSGTDFQGSVALYLGTLAHAVDYDDISHPAYCHATAALLPPILIRALINGNSGDEVIRSYIVGLETLGQLGRKLNTAHYEKGWHATGTFGAVGATAALCCLENFSESMTRNALSVSASLASGVRANFGTMTKPLHAGLAGRSAILATQLASVEFTSAYDGIEGKFGFMNVFGGHSFPIYQKPWGDPLEILTESGIGLKAYPCCAATHTAIDAALRVRNMIPLSDLNQIESIRVGASRFAMEPLIYKVPKTPLEAKFCMEYCVASALIDGELKMSSFTESNISRNDIADLMKKITFEVDAFVENDREFAVIFDLKILSKEKISQRVDVASGKPGNWLTQSALKSKFMECVGNDTLGPDLFSLTQDLRHLNSMVSLASKLYQCLD